MPGAAVQAGHVDPGRTKAVRTREERSKANPLPETYTRPGAPVDVSHGDGTNAQVRAFFNVQKIVFPAGTSLRCFS